MKFSFFREPRSNCGCVCERVLFLSEIEKDSLRRKVKAIRAYVAEGKKDEAANLKRSLPSVTWQGLSKDGSHKAASMVPNSLYMLDVDDVKDPRALLRNRFLSIAYENHTPAEEEASLDDLMKNAGVLDFLKSHGVYAIHITPSGRGIRIVAQRKDAKRETIADNQRFLAHAFAFPSYDESCKDFSRLAYLCPREDFIYLDLDLWDDEDTWPFYNNVLSAPVAAPQGPALKQREFPEAVKEFRYNNHLVSEIAQRWTEERGVPPEGERNNYYMKMAKNFRHITDDNIGVLLCQLPDLGLGIQERERCVEHAVARPLTGEMPIVFRQFLINNGYCPAAQPAVVKPLPTAAPVAAAKPDPAKVEKPEPEEEEKIKLPALPPVFKEFCSIYPDDFAYPAIVALLPTLGTLATRLRATYIDGRVQTTSFIGVIFAPPASGKSFARDIVSLCTTDLARHDKISVAKEKLWKREMKVKRNAENPPEEPHAPYRMVQSVISVPRLLERQEDACGLHQFSFTEEIDTLKKSNAGGSYAQKSDLYRQAFDNAEYGQDYMSLDTFTGSVKLYYNILMLGTPNQLYQFFNDAENGLVSRCCFAEIRNQEFAKIPFFKSLSERQLENITNILNRFEAMTYTRKNAMSDEYVVNNEVNIDAQIDFIRKPLMQWLERQRIVCMQEGSISKDIFRRRSAVKAFRLAMICVGMFDNITPARQKMITEFTLWFADRDLEHIERAFGKMLSEQTGSKKVSDYKTNIFEALPEQFSTSELDGKIRAANVIVRPNSLTRAWLRSGLIKKVGFYEYKKIDRKSEKK